MLAPLLSPLPSINIEFAAEPAPFKEPRSPFDKAVFTTTTNNSESYRSYHLLPPPVNSPKEVTRPVQATRSRGLDSARFEALRLAARKNYAAPEKQDLRKVLAIRGHQSKQMERRSLFLSKIEALPQSSAVSLPVTPPESPAVFHFTLPSPGLVSPLALFESLDNGCDNRPVRVEQVDFRNMARKEAEALAALTGNMKQSLKVHGLPVPPRRQATPPSSTNSSLPSLDQISKRLGGNVTVTRAPSPPVSRLPAFLQRSAPQEPKEVTPVVSPRPAYPTTAAKRALLPTGEHGPIARPTSTGTKATRAPVNPSSVTLSGPHIASTRAPTPLTAEALTALAYRAERGSVMMERLQRRFSAPAHLGGQATQRILARPIGGF